MFPSKKSHRRRRNYEIGAEGDTPRKPRRKPRHG